VAETSLAQTLQSYWSCLMLATPKDLRVMVFLADGAGWIAQKGLVKVPVCVSFPAILRSIHCSILRTVHDTDPCIKPGLVVDGNEKQKAEDVESGQIRFLDLSYVDVAETHSGDMEVLVVFGFQPPKAGEFEAALSKSAMGTIFLQV
jgi:hypothetical protein